MAVPQVLKHWFTETSLLEIIFADGKQAAISKGRDKFCLELRNGRKLLACAYGSWGEDGGPTFEACGQKSKYVLYVQKALEITKEYNMRWGEALAEEAITQASTALWLNQGPLTHPLGAAFRYPHDI